MATTSEASATQNELASTLVAGLDVIDQSQTVEFTLYRKFILPVDGFVFWIRADQLSDAALLNWSPINSAALNTMPTTISHAPVLQCKGSLHYTTVTQQGEGELVGLSSVVFTTATDIQDLELTGPSAMYVGEIDGIFFAFSQRTAFYRQANLYHYTGNEIAPSELTQLVDDVLDFNATAQVVSNSLPIWLALTRPTPFPWLQGVQFNIYPSFLLPDNEPAPYIAIHNDPNSIEPLQSTPYLDASQNQWQLVKERVTVTTYGLRNAEVMNFIQYVYNSSLVTDTFGISNSPLPRDEKRVIPEISALAMKKTIQFDIVYNQGTMRQLATQLILSCATSYHPN